MLLQFYSNNYIFRHKLSPLQLGQEVLRQELERCNGEHTFQVDGLAEEVYFYQVISTGTLVGNEKLVKHAL